MFPMRWLEADVRSSVYAWASVLGLECRRGSCKPLAALAKIPAPDKQEEKNYVKSDDYT